MKCIRSTTDGTIARVRNQEAATAVKTGAAYYVPKKNWKKAIGRDYYEGGVKYEGVKQ